LNILFWNLHGNDNVERINHLLIDHDIDVAFFSEFESNSLDSCNKSYHVVENKSLCEKVSVVAKNHIEVSVKAGGSRYIILSCKLDMCDYILVGLHLNSNIHSGPEERKSTIRYIVDDIKDVESELNTNNTLVIGDFNCSPFDSEMTQKDTFNCVLYKGIIMENDMVKHEKREYKRFYNPMLDYISEKEQRYGSYYYSCGINTLYWYTYDQVILRRELVDKLKKVVFCKEINKSSIVSNQGIPIKGISDHLPLLVEV